MISCPFHPTANVLAKDRGLASLSVVEIDHPVGAPTMAEVEAKADRIVKDVERAFVEALAPAPLATGPSTGPALITVPAEPSAANDFMFDAGWTDGLPCIPPTSELVDSMILGSFRGADDLIAVLPPRMGAATVRQIAICAVMAGCLPEYMPVVIAAVEGIADDAYGLSHRAITTHPGAPLIIVNGPIVRKIGLNAGTGVFGPGWRANATIGRAVRLAMVNIGGALPGITDMAQHGHPGKYSYCIAEDEEANPWEPLHVERGFRAEQSVVTVLNAEAPHNISENMHTTAREILTTCASSLAPLGSNNLYSQGEPVLALGPEHAAFIAADGWNKFDVKLFIYEKARQPWALVRGRGKSLGPRIPKWLERPLDTDMVPILTRPDELIVIVCGGAGGKSMAIPTAGAQSRSVSREVRLD